MTSILQGLAVLAVVICVGFLLARFKVTTAPTQDVLARLVFFVATPALLFRTLSAAPAGAVLSSALGVTACATAVGIVGYLTIARLRRRPLGPTVIGALSSSYVNAGNLGIPICTYLFGTASYVAPVMMYQLVVLAPIAFAVLDSATSGRRPSLLRIAQQPVRNPLVLASAIGVVIAVTGIHLPDVVAAPIDMIAGIAVPGALLAFGMSLHGAPLPGRSGSRMDLLVITSLKLVIVPAVAYVLARFAFGLHGITLLAATLCAALPTAQNVFIYSLRYRTGESLARESVLVTTVLCVPVLIGIVALVHG